MMFFFFTASKATPLNQVSESSLTSDRSDLISTYYIMAYNELIVGFMNASLQA